MEKIIISRNPAHIEFFARKLGGLVCDTALEATELAGLGRELPEGRYVVGVYPGKPEDIAADRWLAEGEVVPIVEATTEDDVADRIVFAVGIDLYLCMIAPYVVTIGYEHGALPAEASCEDLIEIGSEMKAFKVLSMDQWEHLRPRRL